MIPRTHAITRDAPTDPLTILLSPSSFVECVENLFTAQTMGLKSCLSGRGKELFTSERVKWLRLKLGTVTLAALRFTGEEMRCRGTLGRGALRRKSVDSMELCVLSGTRRILYCVAFRIPLLIIIGHELEVVTLNTLPFL